MSGFIEESALRSKAALIGRTVTRQREQVVIPEISFTCAGTISQWRFVAERISGGGRNRYPELQVWRPQQDSPQIYALVQSVTVSPQSTAQSNVYTHTMASPIHYQTGDVLGLYQPLSDASAYKVYYVQHGGPDNYHLGRQDRSSTEFDSEASGVRVRRDYPLVGVETGENYSTNPHHHTVTTNTPCLLLSDSPQCVSGFLNATILDARAQSLSEDDRYQAMSNQQRLIPSLTYGCLGKIGRILVAAQNRGTGGGRDRYPQIQVMRASSPSYYLLQVNFDLNELTAVNSPNVLEFTATSSTYIRAGDVIRIYQPPASDSVYQIHHEPGVGPQNYYINDGFRANTRTVFPIGLVSSEDVSQPLFRVELSECVS